MTEHLQYEEAARMTHEQLLEAFNSDDPLRIEPALWSATHDEPDWRWLQDQCLRFLDSPDQSVRWAAASCLGVIAMTRGKLDVERVIPRLEEAGREEAIRPAVEDSLSYIREKSGVLESQTGPPPS